MRVSALPQSVRPIWARPDVLPWDGDDCAPGEPTGGQWEDRAPGELTRAQVGDRLRADLLPEALACRDYLSELAVTPTRTVRALLARADRLIRKVSDPAWSPDGLDNALTELTDLLDRLRVLMAACAVAPHFAKRMAEVQCFADARARLLSDRLALLPALPTPLRRCATLASSLSCSGPPAPLRNVASLAACDDVQTVITR